MSVAVIGAVIGVAGTAYGVYSQQQAISAANSAHPRPFVPINIPQVAQMALAADVAGYRFSDEDWKTRFPKLVMGRDYNIRDVGANLRGQTSPVISQGLSKAGLSANLGSTEAQQSVNLGLQPMALEQRDRNYFQRELSMNPPRSAGLSGGDVTKLAAQNTGAQNAFNSALYGNRINAYNTQVQQSIQNQGALFQGLGALGGLYSNYQQNQSNPYSNSTDPAYYHPYSQGGPLDPNWSVARGTG